MRASTAEQVAHNVLARIDSGQLLPGTQLSEIALASQHDISRNTLREAFRLLERDGLVEHRPHRGVFVRVIKGNDLKDLYAYRRFLELGAVTHLNRNAELTHQCLSRMHAACDSAEVAVGRQDWIAVGAANTAFHQAIIDLVGSPRLSHDGQIALAQARLVFLAHPTSEEVHGPFVAENRGIVTLLTEGKTEAARAELEHYLLSAEAANLALAGD